MSNASQDAPADEGPEAVHSSIFAQTNAISKFLEENEELYQNDECFSMLKAFFEIFNDQLRINFELRNRMARETQKKSFDPKGFEDVQTNVAKFLKRFAKASGTDVSDMDEASNVLADALERYSAWSGLRTEFESVQKKKEDVETEIQRQTRELAVINEKLGKNNENDVERANSRIDELRSKLLTLSPEVRAKRNAYEARTKTKSELVQQVKERREAIEITKQKFDARQRKRKVMKRNLKQAILDAKTERQQFLAEEQPLMKALEEAQSELETIQKMSQEEMKDLEQQRLDMEMELQELRKTLRQRGEEKQVLVNVFRGLEKKATIANSRADELVRSVTVNKEALAILDEKRNELLSDASTAKEQLEIFEQQVQTMDKDIEEKKSQIEDTKKENNKIESKIRVHEDNIAGIRKSNRRIKCSVNLQESELTDIQYSLDKQSRKRAGYEATLSLFEQLKRDLGLKSSATATEVANQAVSLLKPSIPALDRPKHSSVSSDLELLRRQLTHIESFIK